LIILKTYWYSLKSIVLNLIKVSFVFKNIYTKYERPSYVSRRKHYFTNIRVNGWIVIVNNRCRHFQFPRLPSSLNPKKNADASSLLTINHNVTKTFFEDDINEFETVPRKNPYHCVSRTKYLPSVIVYLKYRPFFELNVSSILQFFLAIFLATNKTSP